MINKVPSQKRYGKKRYRSGFCSSVFAITFRVAVFTSSVLAYIFRFKKQIQLEFRVAVFISSVLAYIFRFQKQNSIRT